MSMTATLNIRVHAAEIALWKRAAPGRLAPWVREALNRAAMTTPGMGAIILELSRATDDGADEEGAEDGDSASGWIAGPPHPGEAQLHVDAKGNVWGGAATFDAAPWRISSAGRLRISMPGMEADDA